jgi:hypothetical protein
MKRIAMAAGIMLAILREIFDETAYARFLERGRMTSSAAAYSAFLQERENTQARKARCC